MIKVKKWAIVTIGTVMAGFPIVAGTPQRAIGCPSPSRPTKSRPTNSTPNTVIDDPSNPVWTPQRVAIMRDSIVPLPCASAQLSLYGVMDSVFNLPEVKQKTAALATSAAGRAEIAALLLKSKPSEQTRYYTIQVFEQHPRYRVPLWLLRVNQWTGAIDVRDNRTSRYVPLEQWRQQR